jgi:ABC-type transport system substrate-binding protein
LIELIYAGLLDYDASGRVANDLAERVDVQEDGRVYLFSLRHGVRFHDGSELSARDIERTFLRGLAAKTPNPAKSFYFGIEGAEDYATGKAPKISGLSVLGSHLVRFRLVAADATFPAVMAMQALRPVCPTAGVDFQPDFFACGAGPFRLRAWAHGESVTLARHDAYHHPGQPYLDGVQLQLGVSFLSQRMKLVSGDIDLMRDFVQADLLRFLRDPRWKGLGAYDAETQMAGEAMNTELRPMDQVEVRRAISSAINRDEYRLVKPTVMTPLNQPIPQGVPGHNPALKCQSFNLAEALGHMKNAGYAYDPATGQGGYPEVIPYYAYGNSLPEYTSQVLAQQLRRIGIRIDVRLVSYAAWNAISQKRRGVPFSYQGWRMDYADPSDFTEALFHTRAIDDENSTNAAFYSNPVLDAQMESARRETDAFARAKRYDQIQEHICSDAPWAFTYAVKFFNLRQGYVRNYRPHPLWGNDVREAWLDQGKPVRDSGAALLAPARTLRRSQ